MKIRQRLHESKRRPIKHLVVRTRTIFWRVLILKLGDSGHDFPMAAKLYSEAIEKNPNDSTLWCNRAYARMKLEEFGYALSDASAINQLWLRRIDETE